MHLDQRLGERVGRVGGDAVGQEGAARRDAGAHDGLGARSARAVLGDVDLLAVGDAQALGVLGRELDLLLGDEELAAPARSRPRARPRSGGRCRAADAPLDGGARARRAPAVGRGRRRRRGPAAAHRLGLRRARASARRGRRSPRASAPRRTGPPPPAGRTPSPARSHAGVQAAARPAISASTHQPGADLAGVGDGDPQPLQAAVGVHHRALLLGVGLGGEDDVGVLGQALGQHRGVGDDERGASAARAPTGRGRARRAPGRCRTGAAR